MIGTAFYDLSRNPPSFNFVDFLLYAEQWRIKNGLEKIVCRIMPGPMEGFRQDCLPPKGGVERTRWLNNIVIPMSILLPSCGEPCVIDPSPVEGPNFGRGEYLIGFKTTLNAAEADIYPLRAPQQEIDEAKLKYGNYVTITIRNTGWWVDRTSKIEVWDKVAEEIEKLGYKVVFIPDGVKPDQTVNGFTCDKDASQFVLKRAGLYAGAQLNMGIPNGPLWMCWFMGSPTLICKMIGPGETNTAENSYRRNGLIPGTNIKNCKPRQHLLWHDEDAEKIVEYFKAMMFQ